MLRLSKKTDYALMAMKHLALHGDRGASSAREIAEQYDIPAELMAKVLQRLVRRGLLVSHQGTRGGYQLARPATLMSVADVIQAVDGPLTVTACSTDDHAGDQYWIYGACRRRYSNARQAVPGGSQVLRYRSARCVRRCQRGRLVRPPQ